MIHSKRQFSLVLELLFYSMGYSLTSYNLCKIAGLATTQDSAAPLDNSSSPSNLPKNGAEWVEMFVSEMTNATSIDDARSRAMRLLESLEKSISANASSEVAQGFQKVRIHFFK